MTDWLMEAMAGVSPAWRVILLAMLPVVELRGAIPLALAQGMGPVQAMLLGTGGNLVVIVPLLLLLAPISRQLGRLPWIGRLVEAVFARARRHSPQVEKYGALGLGLFVAIPAPGTGAWTGCIIAVLLGMPFWSSLVAIALGVVVAGLAVTLAGLGFFQLLALFDYRFLVVLTVAALALWWWRRQLRPR